MKHTKLNTLFILIGVLCMSAFTATAGSCGEKTAKAEKKACSAETTKIAKADDSAMPGCCSKAKKGTEVAEASTKDKKMDKAACKDGKKCCGKGTDMAKAEKSDKDCGAMEKCANKKAEMTSGCCDKPCSDMKKGKSHKKGKEKQKSADA